MRLCCGSGAFFNAWIFRREAFDRIGPFNPAYRIAADTDFMMRFALKGLQYNTLDSLTYLYRQHKGAMTFDVSAQKLEGIVAEKLMLTTSFLRLPELSPGARQIIVTSRTRDTLDLSAGLTRQHQFAKLLPLVWAGSRYDPLWLLRFLGQALRKVTTRAA